MRNLPREVKMVEKLVLMEVQSHYSSILALDPEADTSALVLEELVKQHQEELCSNKEDNY